jgi:hypothetical protein
VATRQASHPFTRRALKEMRRAGWTVKETRSGWLCLAPNGRGSLTLHTSESKTGHVVTRSRLRALGLDVPL